jgi:signal transduction histidine kinase
MRKIIGFFTDSYRDQPLDLLRKAQTLTILSLIFLVLIAVFMMVFFLSTGALTQDSRLLLFLVAGLMVILALIRSGQLSTAVYLYIAMVFVIFSLLVFLSTGRDILKIYNLGYFYMFVLLLAGLIGTDLWQSFAAGILSAALLSWFFFIELLPEAESVGLVGSYDAYLGVLFLIVAGSVVAVFLNYQMRRAFNGLHELNLNLEQQVETRTVELRQAVEDLKFSRQKLVESEKLAALGGLVGGISHEINTPMGNCLTANTHGNRALRELLAEMEAGTLSKSAMTRKIQDVRESQEIIDRNLRSAIDLLERFKRISVDQHEEKISLFSVRSEIENVEVAFTNTLKQKPGLLIRVQGDENLQVYSYPGTIWQILTNLLQNALKHAFPTGEGIIDIIYRQIDDERHQGKTLLIIFEDDGVGMPPEIRERIYEPFFTTNREQGGTGLGLNIVYNLVQQLGGTMNCVSGEDLGTRFVIQIPLEKDDNTNGK